MAVKNIRLIDETACFRIYHSIYTDSENDRDVGRLRCVLGHMPFAVTLMTKLANELQSTAEDLLSVWSESRPDILRPSWTDHEPKHQPICRDLCYEAKPSCLQDSLAYQQEQWKRWNPDLNFGFEEPWPSLFLSRRKDIPGTSYQKNYIRARGLRIIVSCVFLMYNIIISWKRLLMNIPLFLHHG